MRGLRPKKLSNVVGKADTEALKPDNPTDPQNRRISIILLRESLTKAITMKNNVAAKSGTGSVPVAPAEPPEPAYKKTSGNVQFP